MDFQFLEQFGHEHGIFSAGNAHADHVPRPDQLVFPDGFGEVAPDLLPEPLADALLHLGAEGIVLLGHFCFQPAHVAALQAVRIEPGVPQIFRRLLAEPPPGAVENYGLAVSGQLFFQFPGGNFQCAGDFSVADVVGGAQVHQGVAARLQARQRL